MYASAMRLASEVMVDDHIKIGENGLLYRVESVHNLDNDFVEFWLYHTGDVSQNVIAMLSIKRHASLKVYNQ